MTSRYNESIGDLGQRYQVRYMDVMTGEAKVYGYTQDPNGEPYVTTIAQSEGMSRPCVFDRRSDEISKRLEQAREGNTGVLSAPGQPIDEDQLEQLDTYMPALDPARNTVLAHYLRRLADELLVTVPRVHVAVEHLPNLSSPITLLHITRRGLPGARLSHADHQRLFVP